MHHTTPPLVQYESNTILKVCQCKIVGSKKDGVSVVRSVLTELPSFMSSCLQNESIFFCFVVLISYINKTIF